MKNTTRLYLDTLEDIVMYGEEVHVRGLVTREKLAYQTVINMEQPIISLPERKLGYKFMAAEAAWILSGDNKVATIAPYSKQISKFSDNGDRFFGSYGPKVIDQLGYVCETLAKDLLSRQAVMNIWREQPRITKDVPCTVSLQFFVRDGKLHCVDTMRSSDLWLGWPYDIFNMSMISLGICLMMRDLYGIKLTLGNLYLNAGSQHLYDNNWNDVIDLVTKYQDTLFKALPPTPVKYEIINYQSLVEILWNVADGEDAEDMLGTIFG